MQIQFVLNLWSSVSLLEVQQVFFNVFNISIFHHTKKHISSKVLDFQFDFGKFKWKVLITNAGRHHIDQTISDTWQLISLQFYSWKLMKCTKFSDFENKKSQNLK